MTMRSSMYYSWVSNRRGVEKQNKWRDRRISAQNDKRGRCNKLGSWQKSPQLINKEIGINGEAGKNTAIRNFIEIKSSTIFWKYQQKEHKKYKGGLCTWRITCSFAWFSSSRYVVLHCNQKTICVMWNKQLVQQTVLCFAYASRYCRRLCTWIDKREVCNKRGGWQNSPKLINGECWIRFGRVAKNGIINKRGVPSIRDSKVQLMKNNYKTNQVKPNNDCNLSTKTNMKSTSRGNF